MGQPAKDSKTGSPTTDQGLFRSANEMAQCWNANVRDVRKWCKSGIVASAFKISNRWQIPGEAKRPLDRKLAEEILWTLLESQKLSLPEIDLTHWGIDRDDVASYLKLLEEDMSLEARADGSYILTKRGFKLLGRWDRKKATTFSTFEYLSRVTVPIVVDAVCKLGAS